MHPLCKTPLCKPEHLGLPIPPEADSCAVSVCLPQWQNVIDYEEGNTAVVEKMQAGYPRFCIPKSIAALGKQTLPHCSLALPWPTTAIARVENFLQPQQGNIEKRTLPSAPEITVLGVDSSLEKQLRLAWRYYGEGISERQAKRILRQQQAPPKTTVHTAQSQLKQRIASVYQVDPKWIFLFPTGMAAVFASYQVCQEKCPNAPSCQLGFPYVDSLRIQQEANKDSHFFPASKLDDCLKFLQNPTTNILGLFTEIPTNPLLELVDLARLQTVTQQQQIPLIVDDSVASGALINALPYADILTSSLTKWWSGQGNVMGGIVVLNPQSAFAQTNYPLLQELEQSSPLAAEDLLILEKNSRDFSSRIENASKNAAILGNWLEQQDDFLPPHWSGSSNNLPLWEKYKTPQSQGHIPLLSLRLRNPNWTIPFHDALQISKGPSFGTDWSLACAYTLLAHYDELPWAKQQNVHADLIRLSIGIEPAEDLITRLKNALKIAKERS